MAQEAVIQELKKWFLEHGGVLSKVDVKHISDLEGYGLVTEDAVAKAEGVMQVPLDICIHAGMVARSSLKDIILQEPQLFEMEDELLALFLMSERRRGKDSFWYPYIRSLPTRYDTPLYWGDDELKHLQGTNVLLLSRMMSSRMEQDWSGIHVVLVEKYPDVLGGLTKEDYVWALSTVWSRAIGIDDQPTGDTQDGAADKRYMRCLAPVLDMCNHSPQAASSLDELLSLDHTSRVLSLRAHASLPKNAQCHMLYGPYSNSKLLFSYGFTIHDNPYLGVDYWVKVPPTARDAEWKTNLLHSHPLTSNQTYDFQGTLRPGWISPALLATVRVIQLEADEYPLADKVVGGEVAGPRNEKATLTTLSNCLKGRLSTYSTSMEEDLGSLDKLERMLEDLAAQQVKAKGGEGKDGKEGRDDRLTALTDATRRRVHALRVCLDDKVVFAQAATHVQDRLHRLEEEKEEGEQGP